MCQKHNTDPDEEDPKKRMKWKYPDGTGFACYYCWRVYTGIYSVKLTRDECIEEMGKD